MTHSRSHRTVPPPQRVAAAVLALFLVAAGFIVAACGGGNSSTFGAGPTTPGESMGLESAAPSAGY